MSSSASCRSVLASVATHPGAPRAYVLCQSLSKRSVSPPWLRTTTSSWIRLAMNFSSSLPSKTWFTHRALSFRLFFLFFLALGPFYYTGHRREHFLQNHRTSGYFCVIYF